MIHQRIKGIHINSYDREESSGDVKHRRHEESPRMRRYKIPVLSMQNIRRRRNILILLMISSTILLLLWIPIISVANDGSSSSSSSVLSTLVSVVFGNEKHIPPSMQSETTLYEFIHTIRRPPFLSQSNISASTAHISSSSYMQYDVNHCPENPPLNYPMEWPIVNIIHNWNPNTTYFPSLDQRPYIYQGICRFHYSTDFVKAMNYRLAEVPFILRDDPAILQVVYRWNQSGYLEHLLGGGDDNTLMDVEYSTTNQLLYFKDHHKNNPKGWIPPMKSIKMTYKQWLEKATQTSNQDMGPNQPHWYFRVNAKDELGQHFLYHEMPFFSPLSSSDKPNFYLVDMNDLRGINCRFGMMGNTAATHFDASRNFIVLLGGERRYILSHPRNCPHLALFPMRHPSGRHSKLNWSNPNLTEAPEFALAKGNEIVLQPGDVLYLPTYWFHYIVSLELNWQCNARSGYTHEYEHYIRQCGF